MSETKGSLLGSLAGFGVVVGLAFAMDKWCEARMADARLEAEAICRRAIERNYSTPADKAAQQIKEQRQWEGR